MRYKWTPKVYPPIDAVWVVFDGLTSYIHITSHRRRMHVRSAAIAEVRPAETNVSVKLGVVFHPMLT